MPLQNKEGVFKLFTLHLLFELHMMRMIRTQSMTAQTVRNMACVPLEEQLKCCICLDTYTDPVSIPCGHNFCLDCIEGYWNTKKKAECPLCKEVFKKRPQLRINRTFAEIIDVIKRFLLSRQKDEGFFDISSVKSEEDEVPCDVSNDYKSASVKSCLVCQASYCEIHLTPHLRESALQRHRLMDPDIFSSSHLCRNHNKPLTRFCKQDHTTVCEKCIKMDHKHHKTVPMVKESDRIKTNLRDSKAKIQFMIQTRLRKMKDIENSAALSKKFTEEEIKSSSQVCSKLITTIQTHLDLLIEELKQTQEEAENRAEGLLDELEQEINDLQIRNSELQHLELTQKPLHVLQSFPSLRQLPSTREWSEITVPSDNCVGVVRKTVSNLVDVCRKIESKLSEEEVDKMNQYAVEVTLDPDTASGWLLLSADRKKVSCQKNKIPVPNNTQRFDSCVCVLGKQSFTSGRYYWVVQVGDKTDWDLGLARESINRKGVITVRPDRGYWAICRRKGVSLSACAGPSITLQLREPPQKVGVFLNYEEGLVSFYDAEAKTHIYTYSGCDFTEPVYPYFNPCVQDQGKNAAPLVICPLDVNVGQNITIESVV
ncbi:E3 ubiquitin-protein ligase TRIM39 isoform X1 [Channa argus]|uniref:E3 ubiquitin-protein ligase TRIM39 isoform X1 n=1 Tax=Channa argus TaxID=215402 RepID=UPI0035221565